jgi:hypothetical protein
MDSVTQVCTHDPNTHQWKYVCNLEPGEIAAASACGSGLACDQAAPISHEHGNASFGILNLPALELRDNRATVDSHGETVCRLEEPCGSAMVDGSAC